MFSEYVSDITSKVFQMDNIFSQYTNIGLSSLFVAITALKTVYIRKLLRLGHIAIGADLILIGILYVTIFIILVTPYKSNYAFILTPRDIIALVMPFRIFVCVFHTDIHLLPQCLINIILLNTCGLALFGLLFGFAMSSVVLHEINWGFILSCGMALSSIDCRLLIEMLQKIDIPNTTLAMMFSECVTILATSTIVLDIYLGYLDGVVVTPYQTVFILLRMVLTGLIIGAIVGKVCALLVNPDLNSHEYLILTWIICAHVMYNICEGYLYVSGSMAVLSFAIFMSAEKNRVSLSSFQKMEYIISNWHYILTVYAYHLIFGDSIIFLVQYFSVNLLFMALCAFMFRVVARCLVVLIVYPFMRRHTKHNANAIMMMIFMRRGVLELCKLQILLHHPLTHSFIEKTYQIALIMITCEVIMDNTVVKLFFRNFGTNVVSAARRSNIESSLALLENTREIYVHMFQMDRGYGDANWQVIQEATNLRDWEEGNKDSGTENKESYGFKPSCVECQENSGALLTPYEKKERLKELRLLILRTQRVSFLRQRERGLIEKSDLKALLSSLDVTTLSKSIHIEISELSILYKRSLIQNLKKILVRINQDIRDITATTTTSIKWQLYLFEIVQHIAYEVVIYLFILLNTGIFYWTLFKTCLMQLYCLIPYFVFLLDVMLKIKVGLHAVNPWQYFTNFWNVFDCIMLIINTIQIVLIITKVTCMRYTIYGYAVFMPLLTIGQLRLLRILTLFYRLRILVIRYCDYKIENRVLIGYNRAISVLFSYHEVLHILPTIVDNAELRQAIEKEIVKEKAVILAQLNNIQYKFTSVAVLSKTKRIVNTSIATMRETITALKLMGFTDEIEHQDLIYRVEKLRKPILKMSASQINSPLQILKWLPFFESVQGFDTLYKATVERQYQADELILTKGVSSNGIYVIIYGLACMTLTTDEAVGHRLKQFGALPVKDYLCDVDYYHASNHYVISGNCIGILSFLTNRPCDYNVRAMVATKVFFIRAAVLSEAMLLNSDPVHGLYSRLWKYVSINLALSILWRVPIYRSLRVEEIYYYMEKSFLPNTSSKNTIFISDDVEDLILIEGRIRDKISRKIYVAPCYVPRSVRQLQLIRTKRTSIEPQLFLIPIKPELHVKIYESFDGYKRIPMFAQPTTVSLGSASNNINFKYMKQGRHLSSTSSVHPISAEDFVKHK